MQTHICQRCGTAHTHTHKRALNIQRKILWTICGEFPEVASENASYNLIRNFATIFPMTLKHNVWGAQSECPLPIAWVEQSRMGTISMCSAIEWHAANKFHVISMGCRTCRACTLYVLSCRACANPSNTRTLPHRTKTYMDNVSFSEYAVVCSLALNGYAAPKNDFDQYG